MYPRCCTPPTRRSGSGANVPSEALMLEKSALSDAIEAVRRVWGTADVHALALVAMLGEDYDAARSWSGYVQTAMNRDKRLLEELAGLLRRGLGLRGARGDAHAGPCSDAEGALRPRGV